MRDAIGGSVHAPTELSGAATMPGEMARKRRWGDLGPRIASAIVLVPVALLAIRFGGAFFAVLVGVAACGMAYEWLTMCKLPLRSLAVLPFAALPVAAWLTLLGSVTGALLLLALATLSEAAIARGLSSQRPTAFGILYVGLASVALIWLRQRPDSGLSNVLVLLLIIWASDIGAYAVGRAVGGPLLAPSISPGKTWSGAVGGVLAVALVGLAAGLVLNSTFNMRTIVFAIGIGIVAQLGDLFESRLKRHFGVKDSGALIPGHGGLLDRLDAVLAAAPVAALLALALGRGVSLWG
jgi:phosphatidate cytidylyltransferase